MHANVLISRSDHALEGFVHDPLSRISFARHSLLPHLQMVPFSEELRNQYGGNVLCLPFTTSPLSLPAAALSLSREECTFGPDGMLRFNPASLNVPLVSGLDHHLHGCS
jgi:hypothetical protein